MSSNEQVQNVFKSRKIILELLKTRGYNVNDFNNFTINEVNAMIKNNQLDILVENNANSKIYIKYHIHTTKIRMENVYEYMEDLFNTEEILSKQTDELIIIINSKINDTFKTILQKIYHSDRCFINIYNMENYLFNILDLDIVPKHTVLSKEEKDKIKKKYNIFKDSEFPDISRFDPVAKVIGLKPGQLCKIERPSHTAITSNYYRLCI